MGGYARTNPLIIMSLHGVDTETLSNTAKRTFEATSNRVAGHLHVLLITTGSVASVKAPLIVEGLLEVTRDDITTEVSKFIVRVLWACVAFKCTRSSRLF